VLVEGAINTFNIAKTCLRSRQAIFFRFLLNRNRLPSVRSIAGTFKTFSGSFLISVCVYGGPRFVAARRSIFFNRALKPTHGNRPSGPSKRKRSEHHHTRPKRCGGRSRKQPFENETARAVLTTVPRDIVNLRGTRAGDR
jgi:hypothetical protein